ncbi:baseplate hub [Halorubrum tailed virus 25]|uniref:Baseplate hub n=1 Tax=Halorubrum tailed virus 25 TaxID=2878006 RepID=A0AAE8XY52_9CAUD|nr:baseplate hub [Halorubrum tailed virus 25]UBF22610.1 baseplate hub [Halorubrum tailed virus 25]
MTCSLKGGPDLKFLESGLTLNIRDLTTRSSRGRYDHAKIQLSKKDGDLLAREGIPNEPVHVVFDEVVQNRYIYPKDSLEIGHREAWLKIYDARKILDSGILSNYFNEVEVGDVMDYILENREDPYNVITGWKAVTPETAEQSRQDAEEDVREFLLGADADAPQTGLISGPLYNGIGALARFIGFMGKSQAMPYNTFRGLDFEDVSPNQAIAIMEDTFNFQSWVDNDGILWIGQPEANPQNRYIISGSSEDREYVMKEYNVTEGSNLVTQIEITGKTKWGVDSDILRGGESKNELFPIAKAYIVDDDGNPVPGPKLAPSRPVDIWDLAALEDAATQALVNEQLNFRNGTIVFNGAASKDKDTLAQMGVGDQVIVGDYISHHCANEADGGAYVVEEVQHKVNTRTGWSITAKVGTIPPEIDSASFYWNATDQEVFNDTTYGGVR